MPWSSARLCVYVNVMTTYLLKTLVEFFWSMYAARGHSLVQTITSLHLAAICSLCSCALAISARSVFSSS